MREKAGIEQVKMTTSDHTKAEMPPRLSRQRRLVLSPTVFLHDAMRLVTARIAAIAFLCNQVCSLQEKLALSCISNKVTECRQEGWKAYSTLWWGTRFRWGCVEWVTVYKMGINTIEGRVQPVELLCV
jgi:hypothetical protein